MTDHALHAFRAATARTCRPFDISTHRNRPLFVPALRKGILFLCGIWALATCGVFAQSLTNVNLAWNPSSTSGISGYNVYYGVASLTYTNMVSVGNVTNASVPNLTPGVKYYFAVAAVDSLGLEGDFSSELSYLVPTNTPPTTLPPTVVLSSPANGATYLSPATIAMTASVVANGHTITSVQFYNGTALLGQTATAPYSFTWNAVSAGTYSLTAKAVYDAGATVLSPPVSITVQGLPAPWQTVDIGAPGVTGSATILNGLYTVKGAGNISGSADKFRFLYQGLSGDGEIRCQCSSVQNAGAGGCLGVMVRESLTTGSRYALMGMTSGGAFRWQRRSNTSGGTSATKSGPATPPNAWIRLVRTGNTLSGYKSTDGTHWTLVNSANVSMATNIYFGLAVASGSTTALNTAVFTNVIVVP